MTVAERNSGSPVWQSVQVPEWRMVQAREEARAALRALRKPTGDMIDAGNVKIDAGYNDGETVWAAMIEAALRESVPA